MASEDEKALLPKRVRYVKNGQGGAWWREAKGKDQVHFGWNIVRGELLQGGDLNAIEGIIRGAFNDQGAATRDLNQLRSILEFPSQHIWVTIEDGFLWWTTVKDDVVMNPDGESQSKGHFWLACAEPWRNTSLTGKLLAVADLPGNITMTAAFRSTVCVPREFEAIRRLISGEENKDTALVTSKRVEYEGSLTTLITRLSWKDFELLIDLILVRTGWIRTSAVGGKTEGVDIEAENFAADEVAFVQVKSSADQGTLLDYISRFEERTDYYDRMIMAVHSPSGEMKVPATASSIQLWKVDYISKLAVRLGLGAWIESRLP